MERAERGRVLEVDGDRYQEDSSTGAAARAAKVGEVGLEVIIDRAPPRIVGSDAVLLEEEVVLFSRSQIAANFLPPASAGRWECG
jgi:hypothetical protein